MQNKPKNLKEITVHFPTFQDIMESIGVKAFSDLHYANLRVCKSSSGRVLRVVGTYVHGKNDVSKPAHVVIGKSYGDHCPIEVINIDAEDDRQWTWRVLIHCTISPHPNI